MLRKERWWEGGRAPWCVSCAKTTGGCTQQTVVSKYDAKYSTVHKNEPACAWGWLHTHYVSQHINSLSKTNSVYAVKTAIRQAKSVSFSLSRNIDLLHENVFLREGCVPPYWNLHSEDTSCNITQANCQHSTVKTCWKHNWRTPRFVNPPPPSNMRSTFRIARRNNITLMFHIIFVSSVCIDEALIWAAANHIAKHATNLYHMYMFKEM